MQLGPKKFNGTLPNCQLHQHTNKKVNYAEFDTITRLQSAQTAPLTNASGYVQKSSKPKELEKMKSGGMSEALDALSFSSTNLQNFVRSSVKPGAADHLSGLFSNLKQS
jgi:hypothetical protein